MIARRVSFTVYGTARPKGSAKAFVSKSWAQAAVAAGTTPRAIVTADNTRGKPWELLIAGEAQRVAGDGLFLGPVAMTVCFVLARPKTLPRKVTHHTTLPDLDKLLRSVFDALTGILYLDDKQVVELRARKVYTVRPEAPHICVTLETVDAAPTVEERFA